LSNEFPTLISRVPPGAPTARAPPAWRSSARHKRRSATPRHPAPPGRIPARRSPRITARSAAGASRSTARRRNLIALSANQQITARSAAERTLRRPRRPRRSWKLRIPRKENTRQTCEVSTGCRVSAIWRRRRGRWKAHGSPRPQTPPQATPVTSSSTPSGPLLTQAKCKGSRQSG